MTNTKILSINPMNQHLFINIIFSIGCLLFSLIGLFVDDRILQHSPIWLKPLKFAISSILFSTTLVIFLKYLSHSKFIVWANLTIAWMLNLELAIIYLQAFRGRLSHFNYTSLEDMILFQIMAFGIVTVWISFAAYIYNFFQLDARKNPMIHAIRLSIVITFVSMSMAFAMTNPSSQDIDKIIANKGTIGLTIGSHSVAEKDPSKLMPITKWARTGGDLRIAHFFGLHAIQILPLLTLLLTRIKFNYSIILTFIYTSAIIYLALVVYLLLQALSGKPLYPI
ncbi:MAG: hypothetical protein GW761_04865 [Leptospira sp.]|nr:hypothetical protein [Leptospira sp.]